MLVSGKVMCLATKDNGGTVTKPVQTPPPPQPPPITLTVDNCVAKVGQALQDGARTIGETLHEARGLPETQYEQFLAKINEQYGLKQSEVQLAEQIANGEKDYRLWTCGVAASKFIHMRQDVHQRIVSGEKFQVGEADFKTFWEMKLTQRDKLLARNGAIVPFSKRGDGKPRQRGEVTHDAERCAYDRLTSRITLSSDKINLRYDLGQLVADMANAGHLEEFRLRLEEMMDAIEKDEPEAA